MKTLGCFLLCAVMGVLGFIPLLSAQEYVGSARCGNCHAEKYSRWLQSGHHLSLIQVSGSAPQYPFQYHPGSSNVPHPPTVSGTPLGWDDVSYVIGGYHRRTNFTDAQGYLITGSAGDETQWNVWDEEWVSYHPGQSLDFDCARCHATGYEPAGHQGGLPGVSGTWAETGVGCEGCHGPDS